MRTVRWHKQKNSLKHFQNKNILKLFILCKFLFLRSHLRFGLQSGDGFYFAVFLNFAPDYFAQNLQEVFVGSFVEVDVDAGMHRTTHHLYAVGDNTPESVEITVKVGQKRSDNIPDGPDG